MPFSVHEIVVPVFQHGLTVLGTYVEHACAFAEARQADPREILGTRLAPDMLTFADQVSVTCTKIERHTSRLAALVPPDSQSGGNDRVSLHARLDETRAFLANVTPETFKGAENRTYELSPPIVRGWFGAADYITLLVLPDHFFHLATAHAILRHLGVEVGKRDYLGDLSFLSGGYG